MLCPIWIVVISCGADFFFFVSFISLLFHSFCVSLTPHSLSMHNFSVFVLLALLKQRCWCVLLGSGAIRFFFIVVVFLLCSAHGSPIYANNGSDCVGRRMLYALYVSFRYYHFALQTHQLCVWHTLCMPNCRWECFLLVFCVEMSKCVPLVCISQEPSKHTNQQANEMCGFPK